MSDKMSDIKQIIEQFNKGIKQRLPLMESEVDTLITNKSTDGKIIEHYLDTLISLTVRNWE